MPTPQSRKSSNKNGGDRNQKKTILLVEDDTFLAGMYVTKLELEGFRVLLASDGEQAVILAKKEIPNLLLLDIVLPKKSGFEVLQELKANGATKNIPVILLTNLGQKEDVQKGFKLGAKDYLIKAHFMPSEVVAKVKRLVK
ncbi:response regulator [Candidatus Parcubacteria bacterium]|jgi:DNA-binding response OmpR family regulator|nr:MAG: response regulator [Candidatus Parcubacteria bacterium]